MTAVGGVSDSAAELRLQERCIGAHSLTRSASMPLLLLSHCCSASCGPDGAMCAPNLLHAVMYLELVVSMSLQSACAVQQLYDT